MPRASSEILFDLQPVFQKILGIPDLVLTTDMSDRDFEQWDSLNHVRLISATEQKFAIRLTSVEVEKLTCIGDWVACIASKLSA